MGYYIETPEPKNKARQIELMYGGKIVSKEEADLAMRNRSLGVIVVLDNGPFEAAGFAHSFREYEVFTHPSDSRSRDYVILPRQKAEELSGFNL